MYSSHWFRANWLMFLIRKLSFCATFSFDRKFTSIFKITPWKSSGMGLMTVMKDIYLSTIWGLITTVSRQCWPDGRRSNVIHQWRWFFFFFVIHFLVIFFLLYNRSGELILWHANYYPLNNFSYMVNSQFLWLIFYFNKLPEHWMTMLCH